MRITRLQKQAQENTLDQLDQPGLILLHGLAMNTNSLVTSLPQIQPIGYPEETARVDKFCNLDKQWLKIAGLFLYPNRIERSFCWF